MMIAYNISPYSLTVSRSHLVLEVPATSDDAHNKQIDSYFIVFTI